MPVPIRNNYPGNLSMIDQPDLAELLSLRRDLGIVHQVPGRIRLRLGRAILERAEDLGLDAAQAGACLDAVPGIIGARLNPLVASLVIEYDPGQIKPKWWQTLILGDDDEALALVLGLLAGA